MWCKQAGFCLNCVVQLFNLRGEPLPQDVRLGCPLLNAFQDFVMSTYINVLSILSFILESVDPSECQRLPNNVCAVFC